MNKTLILFIIVFGGAAFFIQFTGIYDIVGAVTNLPTTISQGISKLKSDPQAFLQDNGATLATIMSSIGGCTTVFSFIYDKLKKEAVQAIDAEKEVNIQQGQELLNLQTQQTAAVKQIEDLKKERDNALTKAETATSDAQKELKSLQQQVNQLTNEKNELKRMFNYVDEKVEITKKPEPIP